MHFIFWPCRWRSHTGISPAQGCRTGHLAGENPTYDLVVESASLLSISVGKSAQQSLLCNFNKHPTPSLESVQKHQKPILTFLLRFKRIVTKCTCTFKSVKLNVSSPFCHNNLCVAKSYFFFLENVTVNYKELAEQIIWVFCLCFDTHVLCNGIMFVLGSSLH